MAGKPDGGLKDALQLDQAAREIVSGRAAGADNADRVQDDLFAGSSVFGTIKLADGREHSRGGPGRPRGPSKVTKDLVKLIQETGRHPILAMAEIVATPIDVIAQTLGCKKIEAAEYHRKVMSDLAPYVAQKMPTAVQVQGATAGTFTVLDMRSIAAMAAEGGSEFGLAMKLIDATAEPQQNQQVSGNADAQSHDAQSHDEGK